MIMLLIRFTSLSSTFSVLQNVPNFFLTSAAWNSGLLYIPAQIHLPFSKSVPLNVSSLRSEYTLHNKRFQQQNKFGNC